MSDESYRIVEQEGSSESAQMCADLLEPSLLALHNIWM